MFQRHFFSPTPMSKSSELLTNERNSDFARGVIFAHQFPSPSQLFVGIVREKEGRKGRPWDAAGGGTVPKHMAQDNVADMGL